MREQVVDMMSIQAEIKFQAFEADSYALTIATLSMYKYINSKYWHFREHLEQGKISIHSVSTKGQKANFLTKLMAETEID
jgi:hypothetical protein